MMYKAAPAGQCVESFEVIGVSIKEHHETLDALACMYPRPHPASQLMLGLHICRYPWDCTSEGVSHIDASAEPGSPGLLLMKVKHLLKLCVAL